MRATRPIPLVAFRRFQEGRVFAIATAVGAAVGIAMRLIATGAIAVDIHVIVGLTLRFAPSLGSGPPGGPDIAATATTFKGVLPRFTASAHD